VFGNPSLRMEIAADAPGAAEPNSRPLGAYQGAPPLTTLKTSMVKPAAVRGDPTRVVLPDRANRVVTLTAPAVGFQIYIGNVNVSPTQGISLPAGLPYEVSLPGGQELCAVTNAPVYLQLQVQVAPALAGDRERRL
jgi:hypothetical protein